jgi:hypothetical protein
MVEELSKNNGTSTRKIEPNKNLLVEPIKISGKLLAPLMPTITPLLIENK